MAKRMTWAVEPRRDGRWVVQRDGTSADGRTDVRPRPVPAARLSRQASTLIAGKMAFMGDSRHGADGA